jgi:ABC-type uncharacterized transport system YnjBCD permease subunit
VCSKNASKAESISAISIWRIYKQAMFSLFLGAALTDYTFLRQQPSTTEGSAGAQLVALKASSLATC